VSGQLHIPGTLSWGRSPQYPLDRRLGQTQSWSGSGGKQKYPCPCQESKPNHSPRRQSLFEWAVWLMNSIYDKIFVIKFYNPCLKLSNCEWTNIWGFWVNWHDQSRISKCTYFRPNFALRGMKTNHKYKSISQMKIRISNKIASTNKPK